MTANGSTVPDSIYIPEGVYDAVYAYTNKKQPERTGTITSTMSSESSYESAGEMENETEMEDEDVQKGLKFTAHSVPTVASSLQEDTDLDSESDDDDKKEAADVAAALAEKEECGNLEMMLSAHEKAVALEKGYVKLAMKIGSRTSAPLWNDRHFMKPVFTKKGEKVAESDGTLCISYCC